MDANERKRGLPAQGLQGNWINYTDDDPQGSSDAELRTEEYIQGEATGIHVATTNGHDLVFVKPIPVGKHPYKDGPAYTINRYMCRNGGCSAEVQHANWNPEMGPQTWLSNDVRKKCGSVQRENFQPDVFVDETGIIPDEVGDPDSPFPQDYSGMVGATDRSESRRLPNVPAGLALSHGGKLATLRVRAVAAAMERGHEMGSWTDAGTDWGGLTQSSTCLGCGRGVSVHTNPAPNGIDVGGDAVAIHCTMAEDAAGDAQSGDELGLEGEGGDGGSGMEAIEAAAASLLAEADDEPNWPYRGSNTPAPKAKPKPAAPPKPSGDTPHISKSMGKADVWESSDPPDADGTVRCRSCGGDGKRKEFPAGHFPDPPDGSGSCWRCKGSGRIMADSPDSASLSGPDEPDDWTKRFGERLSEDTDYWDLQNVTAGIATPKKPQGDGSDPEPDIVGQAIESRDPDWEPPTWTCPNKRCGQEGIPDEMDTCPSCDKHPCQWCGDATDHEPGPDADRICAPCDSGRCYMCKGKGYADISRPGRNPTISTGCAKCKGTGKLAVGESALPARTCGLCKGEGKFPGGATCDGCGGAGSVTKSAWDHVLPQYRSPNVGWTVGDEFHCPVPTCSVSIGKNLRGDAPWRLAAEHMQAHHKANEWEPSALPPPKGAGYVPEAAEDQPQDDRPAVTDATRYQIVRFSRKGPRRVIRKGLTLGDAQRWCSRDDTHGKNWFHGYERMGESFHAVGGTLPPPEWNDPWGIPAYGYPPMEYPPATDVRSLPLPWDGKLTIGEATDWEYMAGWKPNAFGGIWVCPKCGARPAQKLDRFAKDNDHILVAREHWAICPERGQVGPEKAEAVGVEVLPPPFSIEFSLPKLAEDQ